MQDWLKAVDGYKTYMLCVLAIVVTAVNHFVPLPYVNIDPSNWLNDIWAQILVMTGRNAIAKLQ